MEYQLYGKSVFGVARASSVVVRLQSFDEIGGRTNVISPVRAMKDVGMMHDGFLFTDFD